MQDNKKAITKKREKPEQIVRETTIINLFSVLLAAVITVSLLFSREALDSIPVKYIALSGYVLIVSIILLLSESNLNTFKVNRPIVILFSAGLAFSIWSILSQLNAINPQVAYYEVSRHFLNLIILFFLVITIHKEPSRIILLCKVMVAISLVQGFVGIMQHYEFAFNTLPGKSKPYGLNANRNLFGSAQMLLIPFVLYVLYGGNKLWKTVAIAALGSITASLILSQTRSAWLASIVVITVSMSLAIYYIPSKRNIWLKGIGAFIVAVVSITTFLLLTDSNGKLSKSLNDRTFRYPKQEITLNKSDENVRDRENIWGKTVSVIKDNPVTGVGFDNWRIVVPAYGTEGTAWTKAKYVPDRAHNVYLQIAAENGIPGAALYFMVWALVIYMAVKTISASKNEENKMLIILMLSGILGLMVDGLFSFPTERMEHTLFSLLLMGIIVWAYTFSEPDKGSTEQIIPKPLIALMAIIASLNLFTGFEKYNFERHLKRASAYEKKGKWDKVIEEANAGKSFFVTLDPIGSPLELYSSIAYKNLKKFPEALTEAQKGVHYNPNHSKLYNNIGAIYTEMGQLDSAVIYYGKALKLTPEFEAALKNLALNNFRLERYEACISALNKLDYKKDTFLTSLYIEAERLNGIRTNAPR